MLGSGHGICSRRVDDQASILSGGLQIHIVDPNSGASHHLELPLGGLEHLPRDLGPAPHDQCVAAGDFLTELLWREIVEALHVPELAEHLEPSLSELLGDEYGRLGSRIGRFGQISNVDSRGPFRHFQGSGNGGAIEAACGAGQFQRDRSRFGLGEGNEVRFGGLIVVGVGRKGRGED